MTTFSYTSGDPANLVSGATADMDDIKGPLDDIKTFFNGANLSDTNMQNAGTGLGKLTPLVLYGSVNGGTGAILFAGSGGWSSARSSTGVYVVTFSPTFSAAPAFVVSPNSAAAVSHTVNPISGTSAQVSVYLSTTGAATDSNFMFHVFGAR